MPIKKTKPHCTSCRLNKLRQNFETFTSLNKGTCKECHAAKLEYTNLTGYVYFLQSSDQFQLIKIGYTTNVRSRILALCGTIPTKIQLLGVEEGDRNKEKELHTLFKKFNSHYEWYYPHKKLEDYIANNTKSLNMAINAPNFSQG